MPVSETALYHVLVCIVEQTTMMIFFRTGIVLWMHFVKMTCVWLHTRLSLALNLSQCLDEYGRKAVSRPVHIR